MDFKYIKIKNVGFLLPKKTNILVFNNYTTQKNMKGSLSEIINEISTKEKINYLVYSLNETIVISNRLLEQILNCNKNFKNGEAAIFTRIIQNNGKERSCVYCQDEPCLPTYGEYTDVVNAGYDLNIIDLKVCYRLLRGMPAWINHSFNSILINQARNKNLVCKFDGQFISSCKTYVNPDELLAINELMKSRNLLNVKSYITMKGVEKIISEYEDDVQVDKFSNKKISIIIRTQFLRNELLERALASLYFAKVKVNAEIETILVSEDFSGYPKKFTQIEKLLNIVKVKSPKSTSIPSRTLNIINAVKAAKGDYISFLDDDDYVDVDYFKEITNKITTDNFDLLFFSARALREELSFDGQRLLVIKEELAVDYLATDALRFAEGVNMTPISGFIVKSKIIKEFVAKNLLRHDLSEDYTLLLGMFCTEMKVSIINKILNYISLREGNQNTVTQVDRTKWLSDISDHLSVLYTNEEIAKRLNFYAELSELKNIQNNNTEKSYRKLVASL